MAIKNHNHHNQNQKAISIRQELHCIAMNFLHIANMQQHAHLNSFLEKLYKIICTIIIITTKCRGEASSNARFRD